ncbi:hypothetical protein BDV23DRAFT_165869 [Aspergillus alliaceus]|uniref:Uncharacterized protein n=1 Tax=Petromyces alliaceus TaxID=209559 RepID=A0A5N6FZH8_PETAA|nr:uncharacterized protein BDW43DRAFT_269966 [Aspergillus alliaceus]KAB8235378.1 hypothetical protein BDW43DRAFT_269966 [Aspergillus alliaceus]KAE8384955.1 hypothetical protein BDV23DRAFT_165869 [Aspergillus alliaceus]
MRCPLDSLFQGSSTLSKPQFIPYSTCGCMHVTHLRQTQSCRTYRTTLRSQMISTCIQ